MNRKIAIEILLRVEPYLRSTCSRVESAGSLRRGVKNIGDIEILVIPKPGKPRPQMGQPAGIFRSWPDLALHEMKQAGLIKDVVRDGPKWKTLLIRHTAINKMDVGFLLSDLKIDLFIVTPPAQWGVQMMIRTGPGGKGSFSQWMVTPQHKGGALPDGFAVKAGAIWQADQDDQPIMIDPDGQPLEPIATPEEVDYFSFCGLPYMAPSRRLPKWGRKGSGGTK